MKYVANNGRYGVAFEVTFNNRPMKIEFDRKRVFLDTGNIATSGITTVEDELYNVLLTNKRFKKMIDEGELKLVDEKALKGTSEELDVLKAENEALKVQLKEAEKKNSKPKEDKETNKELKAKDAEIKSLKAQLEALTKDKKVLMIQKDSKNGSNYKWKTTKNKQRMV